MTRARAKPDPEDEESRRQEIQRRELRELGIAKAIESGEVDDKVAIYDMRDAKAAEQGLTKNAKSKGSTSPRARKRLRMKHSRIGCTRD